MRRPLLTRCSLAAAGVTAALVLVPGVAQAAPTPAVPTGGGPLGDVFHRGGSLDSTTSSSTTTTGTSSSSSSGTGQLPPPPSLPGSSPECQAHVQADLQKAIQDLPATIQSIVDTIVSQLGSGTTSSPSLPPLSITDPQSGATVIIQFLGNGQPPTFSSPNPADLPTVEDLQQLANDLQKYCSPKPPTGSGQTPAAHSSAPVAAQAAVPTSAAPQPQAAQQPVSYPGYAPTGGSGPAPISAPLAVLGGALVLAGGAGSVAYGVRRRAARGRG